jgi:hypothetical protein
MSVPTQKRHPFSTNFNKGNSSQQEPDQESVVDAATLFFAKKYMTKNQPVCWSIFLAFYFSLHS